MSEITRKNFHKHILFREDTPGVYEYSGTMGWNRCNEAQTQVLESRKAERKPAADFAPLQQRGGLQAFGVFVVPALVQGVTLADLEKR